MSFKFEMGRLRIVCALALTFGMAAMSAAQTPPAPDLSKQAIENRQAIYKLIGNNFRPIGNVLQGRGEFDAAEISKRAERVAFLSTLASEAYPNDSNKGLPNTKAKADVWANRDDFDKRNASFVADAKALAAVAAKEKTASDAFKSAAAAVAQDCRGCHDAFREK